MMSLLTMSLIFLKSTGTGLNLSAPESSTFVFKLFKLLGTLTNLLISSLTISALKAINSLLAAKLNASAPVASSNSYLVA